MLTLRLALPTLGSVHLRGTKPGADGLEGCRVQRHPYLPLNKEWRWVVGRRKPGTPHAGPSLIIPSDPGQPLPDGTLARRMSPIPLPLAPMGALGEAQPRVPGSRQKAGLSA
jgi:hypothetical protein